MIKLKNLKGAFEPSYCFFYGFGCRNEAEVGILGDGLNLIFCKRCAEKIKEIFT